MAAAVGTATGVSLPFAMRATMTAVTPTNTTNTSAQTAALATVRSFFSGWLAVTLRIGGVVHALPCELCELNDGPLGAGGGTDGRETSAGPRIAIRSSEGVATGVA